MRPWWLQKTLKSLVLLFLLMVHKNLFLSIIWMRNRDQVAEWWAGSRVLGPIKLSSTMSDFSISSPLPVWVLRYTWLCISQYMLRSDFSLPSSLLFWFCMSSNHLYSAARLVMVGGSLSPCCRNQGCAPYSYSHPREGQVNSSLAQAWPCVSFLTRLCALGILGAFCFWLFLPFWGFSHFFSTGSFPSSVHRVWIKSVIFFICFKLAWNCLFQHFYDGCFKSSSKMSNIFDILVLASTDDFFMQFEIFLVLDMVKVFFLIYLTTLGLSCGMWDLVSWPWIQPRSPAFGAWSLSFWTTREDPWWMI